MHHTARKKKKHKLGKRVELTDSDGWTHVTRGGRREPPAIEEKRFKELVGDHQAAHASDMTLEELQRLHSQVNDAWRASHCYRELMTAITEKVLTRDMAIDKAICTGLGNVSVSGPFLSRAKSMYQLVAFESVIELLKSRHDIQTIYLQDPRFNDLEKTFFVDRRGFSLLEHPEAFRHMSNTTFLFAPCNEFSLLELAFTAALPALFLGNDIEEFFLHTTKPIALFCSLQAFLNASEACDVLHQEKLPLSCPLSLGTLYWRVVQTEAEKVQHPTNSGPSGLLEIPIDSPDVNPDS